MQEGLVSIDQFYIPPLMEMIEVIINMQSVKIARESIPMPCAPQA
jgi:hypothetical protein